MLRSIDGQEVTLLYLYWEPRNADSFIELQEHRREVEQFASEVAGSTPSFKAMSYRDFWGLWKGVRSPARLPEHLATIRARYDIKI